MNELERLTKLKRLVEDRRREAERARGAAGQLLGQIRTDFGVKDRKEAGELLERMREEDEKLTGEVEAGLGEFEREWGEKLEGKS